MFLMTFFPRMKALSRRNVCIFVFEIEKKKLVNLQFSTGKARGTRTDKDFLRIRLAAAKVVFIPFSQNKNHNAILLILYYSS